MGNCCSVTLQVPCESCDALINCCIDCTFGRATYVCFMEENLNSLGTALGDLQALKNDVKTRVDLAEAQQLKPLDQVQRWVSRVEEIQVEVNELVKDRDEHLEKLCIGGCCSKSCKFSYQFGKKVAEKLKQINDLKSKNFDEVAGEAAPALEKRQTEQTVGMESMIDEVWRQLEEQKVGIVGIYGMGGVGKTTLLDQIHNKFLDTPNDFDHIIWIQVSRNFKLDKIQNEIGRKIGCFNEKWKNKEEQQKAPEIFRALRRKKFVLLLDDVWERVDLKRVGVPIPDETNWSKLIFTTRIEEVCSQMGAHKKNRAKCLASDEAWNLFKKNVNVAEDILSLDPEIPDLAKIVAKKCAGLPLALIVVGRAMSCKKTRREWKDAIDVLLKSASKFEGMKEVFPLLKLSYDNLSSNEVKSCFLYCALFPEDFSIHKDELIYKWMAEELLKEYADVDEALNKGYSIIGTLVRSCLLEDIRGHVKMHDVIREMALWLACELEETKDNFMVQAGSLLTEVPNVEKWEGVKRMSLMANDIENLEIIPSCPSLLTLLLSNNRLKMINEGFFNSMHNLQVLDLSKNKDITQLPSGISDLVSLQYLDLSETSIQNFPVELKALVKLIYLNLEHASELEVIPHNVIASFSKLRVLRLYKCGTCKSILVGDNEHLGSELQSLKHLDMLTLTIQSDPVFEKFFTSNKLLSCTQFLCLDGLSVLDISSLTYMKRPYSLTISSCEIENYNVSRQSSFKHLQAVEIHDCPNLTDLTWLICAPNLEKLSVRSCSKMREVIQLERRDEVAQVEETNHFAKLAELKLISLPQLQSIYGGDTLPFPYLKRIEVLDCQNLKKLPLNFSNVPKRDLVIAGEEDWWNMLKWEDAFHPCFKPHK
ncbi:unnamed protein product [Prunus armeniaca]|uniref:Uncharacterized protein n=1 Tax=Prunus armeniaca TaxID=36596 RepID=A0A6J5WWR0_PRUAR|nr:unnamed protein product [Prunus armeniaca]